MGIYAIIFAAWNVLGITVFCITPKLTNLLDLYFPEDIYERYNVNMFGCILISLGVGLICPILYILCWFCRFIHWICTVGREDDNE